MKPVLEVRSLRVRRGAREILRGVDVRVSEGERLALMGSSGGGKTTMLRAIVALESFDAGSIDVGGFELRPGPTRRESALFELRRKVGLVFQMHGLFEHLTALENVMLAPIHVFKKSQSEAKQRAEQLLEAFGAAHRAGAYPRELSGGEAQRVAIARALAVDPPLLLMDEPTAALDPARRGELAELLGRLSREGRTLVVATHDVEFTKSFATRVCVLAAGEIVEQGSPEAVIERPEHPETKRLLSAERQQPRE